MILNKRWFFFVCVFSVLIALGVWTWDEEWSSSLAVIIVGVLLLFGYIFLIPNSYRISEETVTVYYGFGIKTKADWNELKYIEDHYSKYGIFPWFREYRIGYFKTRFSLWQEACIPKNRKTKKLIERYYKMAIEKIG